MKPAFRTARRIAGALLATLPWLAWAQTPSPAAPSARNGREIYAEFRAGLANPRCEAGTSARWRGLYVNAPARMASPDSNVLPLFGYVVDALRAANLPTEFALIPFVESGYRPDARSAAGPAGLWQMIAVTARDHRVPMRPGYDGRLSPVDSTQAAVRYLKTLHGMFAGDWRLAAMAFNAGEYRVFGALERSGQVARSADPARLTGLSGITRAYVRKLQALSCVLAAADAREPWLQALDRPVPILQAITLPAGTSSLAAWSAANGRDETVVERLNPAFPRGRVVATGTPLRILAPGTDASAALTATPPPQTTMADAPAIPAADVAAALPVDRAAAPPVVRPRTHTVSRGESPWTIARRYKLPVAELLSRNALAPRAVLRPGMVLVLDAALAE